MRYWVGLFLICCVVPSASAQAVEPRQPPGPTVRLANAKIVKVLSGNDPLRRMQAIASLQNDPESTEALLEPLINLAKTQASQTAANQMASPVMFDLLHLIGSVDRPESGQLLVELLDSPHLGIAMVAADAIGKNQIHTAIEPLKKQVDRPEFETSYGFRFNLLRALAQMEHRDALLFIDELRSQLDGQLRYEIEKLLAKVDIEQFQNDEEAFLSWKVGREPKIVLASGVSESDYDERMQLGPSPQYYGMEIHSKRMMFILDHSGSMLDSEYGMSRLVRAKRELIRVIEQLPADAEFAIMFYSTSVNLWRTQLVSATSANKRDAIAFVNRLTAGTHTNTHGALRRSLEFDDALEAVYLLTDGRPTCGEIVQPQGIITDVVHRNRFRHLNFNTIGIAVDGQTELFLRALAEHGAGEFRKAM